MTRHNLLIEVDDKVKKALEDQARANKRSARKEAEFILEAVVREGDFWPEDPEPVPSPPTQEEILL